jgi:hypothetical protein
MTTLPLAPGSRCAVANYARRNTWLSLDDLAQTAHLAAIEASRHWRADGGASPEWWEARIVAEALSRFVAEARVPVSLPKSKGSSWTTAAASQRADLADDLPADAELIEDAIDTSRAVAEVRRILAEQSEAARAVLLAEEKSSAVARRLGVSVRRVYDDTRRTVLALRAALATMEVVA